MPIPSAAGLVRMLGTAVDLELGQHTPADRVLRHHAADGETQHAIGMPIEQLLGGFGLPATRVVV